MKSWATCEPEDGQRASGSRVKITRGDLIHPEPVDWIWPGWLAAGKMHLLAGDVGAGKTTISLSLAARLSSGTAWPDGSTAERGNVVLWSGEDGIADTIVPRLRAMGAAMTRIHIISGIHDRGEVRAFDPASDIGELSKAVEALGDVRMLIVDPMVSAVPGDSHKNAEVRRGLQPLVDLSQRHACALLGITHFSKGTSGRNPTERVTGSLAFGALARIVMVAAAKQAEGEQPDRHFLARAKSNIGPDGGGFGYELHQREVPDFPGLLASTILWGDALAGTARELLTEIERDDGESPCDFLRSILADGPMLATSIFADAEANGFSKDQVKRAKPTLRVQTRKDGMTGGWWWTLPVAKGAPDEECEQKKARSSHPSTFSANSDAPFAPLEGCEARKGARLHSSVEPHPSGQNDRLQARLAERLPIKPDGDA